MFKRALPCPEFEAFRSEAQRIASALGLARELDVLKDLVTTGPQANFPQEASFETLLAALEKRRLTAYSQALAIVDEPATTLFLLRMQAFLEYDSWRSELSDEEQLRLTEPLSTFATDTLRRLHKRVLKRGKGLVELPDAERHKVRIALKNLRYAVDFFGDLFSDSKVRPYIHAVAKLQDLLGAHNDAVSIERLLQDIEGTAGAQGAKASGIVLGWYGRGTTLANADLRKAGRRSSEQKFSGAELVILINAMNFNKKARRGEERWRPSYEIRRNVILFTFNPSFNFSCGQSGQTRNRPERRKNAEAL